MKGDRILKERHFGGKKCLADLADSLKIRQNPPKLTFFAIRQIKFPPKLSFFTIRQKMFWFSSIIFFHISYSRLYRYFEHRAISSNFIP